MLWCLNLSENWLIQKSICLYEVVVYKWWTPEDVEELLFGNNCLVELEDVNESPLDRVEVEFAVPKFGKREFGVLGKEVGITLLPKR